MKTLFILFSVICLILVACAEDGEPIEQAEPTVLPTTSLTRTPSLEPSVTSEPTNTTVPTLSPTVIPTKTTKSTTTVTQKSVDSESDFQSYVLPDWVSLSLPEDWFILRASDPGQIAFSNKDSDFPYFTLQHGDALLLLFEYGNPDRTPLELLSETYLESLGPDRTIIENAQPREVNGLPAATAKYQSPQPEGTALEHITIVQGSDRSIAFLAISMTDEFDEFVPVFEEMLSQLEIHPIPPAPLLDELASLPAHYQHFVDEELLIELMHPPDWNINNYMGMLIANPRDVLTSPEQSVVDSLVVTSLDELAAMEDPNATLESWFAQAFTMFGWMTLHDAQLVSQITSAEINNQEVVAGVVSATDEGEPIQGIMAAIQQGDRLIVAFAWMRDFDNYREELENIISSIIINPVAYIISDEAKSIHPGNMSSGEWLESKPAEFFTSANAGNPFYFYVDPEKEVAEVSVYDPDGRRVYLNGYVHPDLGLDVVAITPEKTGDYLIVVNSGFSIPGMASTPDSFIIHMLDVSEDSRSLVANVERDLDADDQHNYPVDVTAGAQLVAYVEPLGVNVDSTNMVLELYTQESKRISERHNHLIDGQPITLNYVPEDDAGLTVRVSELEGRSAVYHLLLIHGE